MKKIMILLCILFFCVGIQNQFDVMEKGFARKINEWMVENSGKTYLTGMFYHGEENPRSMDEWIGTRVARLIPIGEYTNQSIAYEQKTEDQDTYEMILMLQENDEKMEEKEQILTKNISYEKLNDFEYLIGNFYTVDSSTSVLEKMFRAESLLGKDMKIQQKGEGPKILIYHTHSQEAFKDSKKGKSSDTIMGMGEYLAEILNKEYGIETLHHKGVYDLIDGKLDRSRAYQLAEPEIRKILKENPSIEVVIDLHRDGVKESTHLVTKVNGKETAQIMFFNGLSRTRANGDIQYLQNPYIEDNLAFSLQMQLCAMEKYPGITRRIYLKSYRYNMHMMPKTLLIEAGAQTNTVKEMRQSMVALAEILDSVLTGEKRFD